MAEQKNIQGMTGNETFEQWFNKTNEIVDSINYKNGVVKIELDYSDPWLPGQPNTNFSHLLTENNALGTGFTVGYPLFHVSIPDAYKTYDTWLDLVHCNLVGRITGITGFGLVSFNYPGDAWGNEGIGGTNHNWQASLFGLVSKIYSHDTTNKKLVMDVIRPGGNAVIKYGDLNGYVNRNIRIFHDNVLFGGSFFMGISSGSNGLNSPGFYQITPICGAGNDMSNTSLYYKDIHYLTITPLNDADQNLNIYLDPRAPYHKAILITGFTAAKQNGSCEILGYNDSKTFQLQNLSLPEVRQERISLTYLNWTEFNIPKPFINSLIKISICQSNAATSSIGSTIMFIPSENYDEYVDLTTGTLAGSNFEYHVNLGDFYTPNWYASIGYFNWSIGNNGKFWLRNAIFPGGADAIISYLG